MNKEKREALEASGWTFGNAEDFLELSAEERCLVELRLKFARGIRTLRSVQKVTQAQLAKRMNTSQPRVAQIEAGSPGVSLDQMISGYITLGGSVNVTLHDGALTDWGAMAGDGPGKRSVKAKKPIKLK